ncbi:unnamed protein product [[Candida] boidinii]|uniref:Unnamed protein product n=1 Tax=Candida boidinii TaxID=5477 RepID=A0ACB5TFX0_CANBO|nr:unnamed protein product [[Candida] boidinii]
MDSVYKSVLNDLSDLKNNELSINLFKKLNNFLLLNKKQGLIDNNDDVSITKIYDSFFKYSNNNNNNNNNNNDLNYSYILFENILKNKNLSNFVKISNHTRNIISNIINDNFTNLSKEIKLKNSISISNEELESLNNEFIKFSKKLCDFIYYKESLLIFNNKSYIIYNYIDKLIKLKEINLSNILFIKIFKLSPKLFNDFNKQLDPSHLNYNKEIIKLAIKFKWISKIKLNNNPRSIGGIDFYELNNDSNNNNININDIKVEDFYEDRNEIIIFNDNSNRKILKNNLINKSKESNFENQIINERNKNIGNINNNIIINNNNKSNYESKFMPNSTRSRNRFNDDNNMKRSKNFESRRFQTKNNETNNKNDNIQRSKDPKWDTKWDINKSNKNNVYNDKPYDKSYSVGSKSNDFNTKSIPAKPKSDNFKPKSDNITGTDNRLKEFYSNSNNKSMDLDSKETKSKETKLKNSKNFKNKSKSDPNKVLKTETDMLNSVKNRKPLILTKKQYHMKLNPTEEAIKVKLYDYDEFK